MAADGLDEDEFRARLRAQLSYTEQDVLDDHVAKLLKVNIDLQALNDW